jgi:hypothetical protein
MYIYIKQVLPDPPQDHIFMSTKTQKFILMLVSHIYVATPTSANFIESQMVIKSNKQKAAQLHTHTRFKLVTISFKT